MKRCEARCGPGGGRAWNGVAAQVACTGGGPDSGRARDSGLGGQGAHVEHGVHARDLGGVEAAERLVEYFRALPRVEGRA